MTPSDMEDEVNHLRELQDYLLCATHSRPGMRMYCHIERAGDGVKGGHREISHQEITLWAQYIVSQRTESNGQKLTMGSETQTRDEDLPAEHQTV